MRFGLDLYINSGRSSSTTPVSARSRTRREKDVDFVVFRENTEGAYVGMGGNFKKGTPDEVAMQEEIHTRKGVERIIRARFRVRAKPTAASEVCMADKSNVMRYGHDLWLRVVRRGRRGVSAASSRATCSSTP